jgi:hypothetical protein
MVNSERIVHNVSMKTRIRNIYFLDNGPEKVQELDTEVGLKKLMATTYEFKIFEDHHIRSYFLKNLL